MENTSWFALKTKSRAEKQVARQLTSLEIENYLPLHRRLKKWKDRNAWVEEPLLKGYVFLKTTEKDRAKAFVVSGIVRYLFVSGKIAKITEKEIEDLKIFCSLAEIKIEKNNLEKGDEIEILSGKLIGFRGLLINEEKRKKIKIYLATMNCYLVHNTKDVLVRKVAT